MGQITIRCPRTGEEVPVGIETDRYSFDTMPVVASTMRCPACGAEHVWSKTYAKFKDDGDPAAA